MSKKNLVALLGVLVVSMSGIGCGNSSGKFTPYTTGSQLNKGEPLAASMVASRGEGSRYDFEIRFADNAKPTLGLGVMLDGEFEMQGADTVEMRTGRKYGMSVTTADALLDSLIDHVTVRMTYKREYRATSKESMSIDHNYLVAITMYDEENRVVGEYEDTLTDMTERTHMLAGSVVKPGKQPKSSNPAAPSSIFAWAAARASSSAKKK